MREFPAVRADTVLVSHPHYDHSAVERVLGRSTVIRTPGIFSGKGFTIRGPVERHAGESGQSFGQVNLIFTITIAGITYCHLGDNRAEIPQSVHSKLGKVDVLMISVDDSQHLLAFRKVDSLIRLLNPKMVIPMHYLYPGLDRFTLYAPGN